MEWIPGLAAAEIRELPSLITDRFDIEKKLGSGAYGKVYRCSVRPPYFRHPEQASTPQAEVAQTTKSVRRGC